MGKVLKRSVLCSVAVVCIMLSSIAVKADGKWFNSYIELPDNSTLNGIERSYDYGNYRLDLIPTTLEQGPRCPGQVKVYIELIRPLYRLGVKYGTQVKYSGTSTFNVSTDIRKTKSIYTGNAGDGKRYFYFSTYGQSGAGYGGIYGVANIYNYS